MQSSTYPDDWGDKFDEELRNFQKRRVEVVEVIKNQTLDMRPIVILAK